MFQLTQSAEQLLMKAAMLSLYQVSSTQDCIKLHQNQKQKINTTLTSSPLFFALREVRTSLGIQQWLGDTVQSAAGHQYYKTVQLWQGGRRQDNMEAVVGHLEVTDHGSVILIV